MSVSSKKTAPSAKPSRLYVDSLPLSLRIKRLIWIFCYYLCFRPTPAFAMRKWRLALLRLFGARIGKGCAVAPTCFLWAPWNLEMGVYVCLAEGVDCYSVAKITLGDYSTVSQRSFLCTASHDISTLERPLIYTPITIEKHAWIGAEAFVSPGVTIKEGAVVGARAVVTKNVDAWTIVAGNPAKFIKAREIKESK